MDSLLVVATVPVTDLDRALTFYRDKVGLKLLEQSQFALRFDGGGGSQLSIYRRPPIERGHTAAHLEVADIRATIAELRARGVVFEEYTSGPLTTEDGVAPLGPALGAWFKDPDGNVIGLRQGPIPGR